MMRMSYADFQRILSYIEEDITRKQVLGGNKVIPPKERLALTIRFLATGETYKSLSYQFRISTRAISYTIKEVCKAIVENMRNIYLKVPSSNEEWRIIAEKFERRWQFPNCIGAIDGKHIVMQPPGNSGSYYYNYKHTNSIVLTVPYLAQVEGELSLEALRRKSIESFLCWYPWIFSLFC